ncbi:MAG TPA: SDR family oxidoreductase [Verrucomicrobiae bacterium]|nr:SDR family oxidoreductase [Verrucomicrobiae bacterium]
MENGKVVMLTGASAGIGRATARAFAKQGANIGLLARGRDGLEAAQHEVEELGGRAIVLVADVSDAEAVDAAAEQLEERFGPIDIWVNDAMTSVFSPIAEMKPEEFRRVTEVNYLGFVYGTLAALKRMRPRNQGVIIQVGSALAYRGIPLQAAYCASKFAIRGFCDSLRAELLHDQKNIRVCLVEMPAVNTTQFGWVKSRLRKKAQPVPPIYQPEVAANAIVYAATHNRREVYVGMPTVKAILASKLSRGLVDCYLAKSGYKSQQTKEPENPGRPNNLYEPLRGDFGAHGDFDDRARSFSLQLWLDERRDLWRGALLAGAALAGLAAISKKRH